MALLELALESQEAFSVSRFFVREEVSGLFDIWIQAVSTKPDVDSNGILDQPMGFFLDWQRDEADTTGPRIWTGLCSHFQQLQAESTGLSTYLLRLVPRLWRLQQRVDHRIFKQKSLKQIVDEVLSKWSVTDFQWDATAGSDSRELTVQYGESDYAFVCRLLEGAGVTFVYRQPPGTPWPATDGGSSLLFSDKLDKAADRPEPLPFVDNPAMAGGQDYIAAVRTTDEARPSSCVVTDYAFQNPKYALTAKAKASGVASTGLHELYERYHYEPGALHEGRGADLDMDRRIDVDRRLRAERAWARELSFETNATDLAPGTVFSIVDHPLVAREQRLLVTSLTLEGAADEEWHLAGAAVFASEAFVPRRLTPKPRIWGVQSATVASNEDKYGRVCIKFPWDRDQTPSCWARLSQGAASAGFGIYTWPQVDDEVLVSFIEGDPDQPIVVGRVYNETHVHPYTLPDHHSRGTWRGARQNELTFEDKEGSEFVYAHATKDLLVEVLNDRQTTVGNDSKESITANRHLLVSGDENKKVAGAASLTVGQDNQLKVGSKHAVDAGQEIHLKSGAKIVLESQMELTLKTPGGFVKLDAAGVTIKGNLVQINCPGPPAGSGSGSAPTEPEEPEIQFDGKPE